MKNEVLETILNSNNNYFIIQSYRSWYDHTWKEEKEDKKIIFISLPSSLVEIKQNKNIDTITVKEKQLFEDAIIDTNLFIYPKYAPFQQFQTPLKYACDCIELDDCSINYTELLSKEFTDIYMIKTYINKKL